MLELWSCHQSEMMSKLEADEQEVFLKEVLMYQYT